jgi:pimeloyl-ACP methyl ester carboxylesterase
MDKTAIKMDNITMRGGLQIKLPVKQIHAGVHPDASAYAKKFTEKYKHKVITGGIGHNLPQEAPEAFAAAILEVDSWVRR